MKKMTDKQKKLLLRIIFSLFIFLLAVILNEPTYLKYTLLTISYIAVSYDVILKSTKTIGKGQVFDENFLMVIATFGAFYIGELDEGVMVMLLYQVGELFQSYAVSQSRQSITELMSIRPDYANLLVNDTIEVVDPDDVQVGSTIVVKAGEKIPLDGVVVQGESFLDTSALTGESVPQKVIIGNEVLSGSINQNGLLHIKTTKDFDESTVSKILELVEYASTKKAKTEKFITKFAKYYTPFVVLIALAIAFVPFILGSQTPLNQWIQRACSLLVISCPCALVISVPLGFFGGIGGAAKNGILIKGSNFIETISKLKTIVFDKTGTLTKGVFKVNKIVNYTDNINVLEIANIAEIYSNHPIATSLKNAFNGFLDDKRLKDVNEISGKGIVATIDEQIYLVGNKSLLDQYSIEIENIDSIGTIIFVANEVECLGYIEISDEIKENSASTIKMLQDTLHINTVMLTGDKKSVAQKVSSLIGISTVYSELLPADKVHQVEHLLQNKNGNLAFVGDGINDAPVLTRADVGIAMGAIGSDAAIEAADIVIMDDDPSKIVDSIKISKRTMSIVYQNIIFALGVKALFLILGGMGQIALWQAIFADVGVSVIAILNSMRSLKVK